MTALAAAANRRINHLPSHSPITPASTSRVEAGFSGGAFLLFPQSIEPKWENGFLTEVSKGSKVSHFTQ
jgi:hypothetical protein